MVQTAHLGERDDLALLRTLHWSLWVAETSSRTEVVDSAGFVPKLISHVRDCLGAPALPVILAPSQAPTCLGEPRAPAPDRGAQSAGAQAQTAGQRPVVLGGLESIDRKSTRLNSSHLGISYAVFCLKK